MAAVNKIRAKLATIYLCIFFPACKRRKKYGERLASRQDLKVTDSVKRARISNPPSSHGMIELGKKFSKTEDPLPRISNM